MFKNKKQKAQVSAPFELLVAIIVMVFVIIAGTYALQNLSENTCLGNKRQDFSNLISALRDVVLGSDLAYRNIEFTTKACYNESYERTYLKQETDRAVCERFCGSGSSCILLYYEYIDEARYEYKYPIQPVCTYLPTNIVFEDSKINCGIDDDSREEVLNIIDPNAKIPSGSYKIYKSSSSGQIHNICFVKIR